MEEFERLTYREMWDTYIESNLPPEPDPAREQEENEAAAMAAATLAAEMLGGVDMLKVRDALKRSRM